MFSSKRAIIMTLTTSLLLSGSGAQNVPEGFKDGDLLPLDANGEPIIPGAPDKKEGLKDGEVEEQYDLFDAEGDSSVMVPEGGSPEMFTKILQDTNECLSDVVAKYDLTAELKGAMDYTMGEDWLKIVQYGSKQEIQDGLGDAIDPLTQKTMSLYGPDVANAMPIEMIEWLKDTTILWVKNKGAGSPTTIDEVTKDKDLEAIKAYYEKQLKLKDEQIAGLEEQNSGLRTENEDQQTKIVALYTKVNEFSKMTEEAFQDHTDAKTEIAGKLASDHETNLKTLTQQKEDECKESKKNLLKMLNGKYSEETKKVTSTLNEICYKSIADEKDELRKSLTEQFNTEMVRMTDENAEQCKTELSKLQTSLDACKTISGGLRFDIAKDKRDGKYSISKSWKTSDDTYNLNGLLFEFGKYDFEGDALQVFGSEYNFIQLDKETLQAEMAAELKPEQGDKYDGNYYEEAKYVEWEDPALYNTDTITDHHGACHAGLFSNACTECTADQMHNKEGRKRCASIHQFCYSLDNVAHCGHCGEFSTNCRTCNFTGECRTCYAGFWELGGNCWPNFF